MIYRLLGVVSIVVGALFGLISLAVLIPFLNTFSGSLLILVAVFGILAWIFLAIGWQLLRPPGRAAAPTEGAAEGEASGDGDARGASLGLADSASDVADEDADAPIDLVLGSGFESFDVVAPAQGEELIETDDTWEPPEPGLSIDERLAAVPSSFKKPYQPAPGGDDTGE